MPVVQSAELVYLSKSTSIDEIKIPNAQLITTTDSSLL